jgi:uncharacterized protein (DUF2342 family)
MARRRKSSSVIDWDFAVNTAGRLVKPGPVMDRDEIDLVVDQLRVGARVSEGFVREFTGLHARSASAPVLVGRPAGLGAGQRDGMATIMDPLVDKLTARKPPTPTARMIAPR